MHLLETINLVYLLAVIEELGMAGEHLFKWKQLDCAVWDRLQQVNAMTPE